MYRWLLWMAFRAAMLVFFTVWFLVGAAAAQPGDVTARVAEVLRYSGVESPPAEEVARLARAWVTAQDPVTPAEQRRAAFAELFAGYAKLHGVEVTTAAMQGVAQFATTAYDGGARMDLRLPEPRGKPSGNYLHVETRGTGPVTLLLISDLGVDGRELYDSFARRNASAYTMHIATLPLAGAARPLPWPGRLDYAARPWLTHIEHELLALLDQPRMKGAVVVGTSAGGYFAARMALERPRQIRGAVLVDALVAMPMRGRANPDAPATIEERLGRLRGVSPAPQFFPIAPVPPPDELRRLIAEPQSTHPLARNWMAFAVKDTAVSQDWTYEALSSNFFLNSAQYQWEFFSTDLTEDMKRLAVPLVVLGAIHDEGSPRQSPPSLSQWDELKLLYPEVPLSVAAFEDTRAYISADAPAEFDRALADFLAGRPVRGKTGYVLPRKSPRAAVMESVNGVEVRIAYGRPAVQERKVWGELVPWKRVWRAGANEATTMTLARDARVEGQALSAGAYSFFVIPAENGEWTVIFNRVARQWGAFNYNPAFDALRFTVKPEEATHQEHLSYRIEPEGAGAARVTLAWEKRSVSFRIEIAPE